MHHFTKYHMSYIVIIAIWLLGISLWHIYVWFLYSCHMDHRSYCMSNCCMYILIFQLHDYFPLLIFSLLDTRAVDMRCVESHIYCFPFPVILFHAINRAQVMVSYYMYHVPYLFLLYCIMKDNKENLGMGRLDGWLGLVGWLSGSIVSHCRGRGLSLIHIWRCRRSTLCRSRWSPYH